MAEAALETKYVYFVRSERLGLVKIGIAENIKKRLASMQTGSADKLALLGYLPAENPRRWEAMLHAKFKRQWVRGEWFKPDRVLNKYIAECLLPPESLADNGIIISEGNRPPTPGSVVIYPLKNERPEAFAFRVCKIAEACGLPVKYA